MRISIDPGLTGTGVCLWINRHPTVVTINPKGSGLDMKLADLCRKLEAWWFSINPIEVKEVLIEDYHIRLPPKRVRSMLVNCHARGVIVLFFALRGIPVKAYAKSKRDKKTDAEYVCRTFGLDLPEAKHEHARDAVHIGWLCHYDKMD